MEEGLYFPASSLHYYCLCLFLASAGRRRSPSAGPIFSYRKHNTER
jgi:hypothetical protein